MNSAVIFTVPDSMEMANRRCHQTVSEMGAPLKSDSGHFVTGVIKHGMFNVDVRVSWLTVPNGTQITVTCSHDKLEELVLRQVGTKFQDHYINKVSKPKSSAGNVIVAVLVLAVLAIVAYMKFAPHK